MCSNGTRTKRLQTELKKIKEDKTTDGHITAGPINDDLSHWKATIIGPTETPYAGREMILDIKYPTDYPFKAFNIKFITPVWHPNIDTNGSICVDILKDKWTAAQNTFNVLLSISSLLGDPNPNSPLNGTAAEQYVNNRDLYNKTVQQYFGSENRK